MRMFSTTCREVFSTFNVAVESAFGARGLCTDVLRPILAEHELMTGEVVIENCAGC